MPVISRSIYVLAFFDTLIITLISLFTFCSFTTSILQLLLITLWTFITLSFLLY